MTPEHVLCMDGRLRTVLTEMMPRLQAEEALLLSNMVGIGTATIEKKERAKMWRKLARIAQGVRRREPVPLEADPKVYAQRLAALGLNVVVQEKLPDGTIREVAE